MKSIMQIKQILAEAAIGSEITVKGWVRTKRDSKNVVFININDGSVIHNIKQWQRQELLMKIP